MNLINTILKKYMVLIIFLTLTAIGLAFIDVNLIGKGGQIIESISMKNIEGSKEVLKGFILLTIFSLLLQVFLTIVYAFTRRLLTREGEYILYNHLLFLDPKVYYKYKTGDIANRVSDNVHSISSFFSYSYVDLVRNISYLLLSATYIFIINYVFGFLFLTYLALFVILSTFIQKKVQKKNYEYYNQSAQKDSFLIESITGIFTIKSLSLFDFFRKKYISLLKKTVNIRFSLDILITSILVLIVATILIFIITFFYLGMNFVSKGVLSFSSFITLLALFLTNSNKFSAINNAIGNMRMDLGSLKRVDELLNEPLEIYSQNRKAFTNILEFKDVGFSYDDKVIVKDVNLKIKKGEFVVFKGKTGSGKTTFLSLVLGFNLPTKGEITFDGVKMDNKNITEIRKAIGYMPQFPFLIDGTLRENITFGEDTPEEKIIDAMKKAGLEKFINELSVRISESGKNLSGGEKQRIHLARIFLRDYDIYLFDEPTSHVDKETERIIIESLLNLKNQEKTVIVATHKKEIETMADRVFLIKDGNVKEV